MNVVEVDLWSGDIYMHLNSWQQCPPCTRAFGCGIVGASWLTWGGGLGCDWDGSWFVEVNGIGGRSYNGSYGAVNIRRL